MIALLVTSRIEGNPNWGLPNLLDSLVDHSANYRNFEVLVKFDSCDSKVASYLPQLKKYPFAVKHIVEPRGRGYIDIHIGYTRAMMLADKRVTVMGAYADDFVATRHHWDATVLAETKHFEDDIYLIHQRPHPCYYRPNFQEQPFYPHFNLDHIDEMAVVDEGPFWSRKLLEICGGLGHVSFTDVWTVFLQWFLYHDFGINRTRFLKEPQIHRVLHDAVDTRQADRWESDRRINFEFIAGQFYRNMVKKQARNVALNILAEERVVDTLRTPKWVLTHPNPAELEHIMLATAKGANERGQPKDSIREYREVLRRFPNSITAQNHLAELLANYAEEEEMTVAETLANQPTQLCQPIAKKLLTHSRSPLKNSLAKALATASNRNPPN
jgi:phenolic acid decarboxylase